MELCTIWSLKRMKDAWSLYTAKLRAGSATLSYVRRSIWGWSDRRCSEIRDDCSLDVVVLDPPCHMHRAHDGLDLGSADIGVMINVTSNYLTMVPLSTSASLVPYLFFTTTVGNPSLCWRIQSSSSLRQLRSPLRLVSCCVLTDRKILYFRLAPSKLVHQHVDQLPNVNHITCIQ